MRLWHTILHPLLIGLFLTGCRAAPVVVATPPVILSTQTASPTLTQTLSPSITPEQRTSTPSPAPTLSICSPLAGYALDSLPEMISNKFNPPEPGSDNPHQGIDLSILDPSTRIALTGNPVQAILTGKVAMVVNDRFPYGRAVLIETPLDQAHGDWWAQSAIPTPAPTLEQRSALTCPAFSQPPAIDPAQRAVYVLYAHLQTNEAFQLGQQVACGQAVGTVGMSGNALNPHLHVEIRAAPAGMQFGSMAHYDASASNDEMAAYCLWRISGLFQLVDPQQVLFR